MTTRVVNRRHEAFDVAIDRSSKWGNPYGFRGTKARWIVASRDEAIRKYREWILTQPDLMAALPELRGKRLGCWCKPLSCHGDVLVELLLEQEAGLQIAAPLIIPVKLNPDAEILWVTPASVDVPPPLRPVSVIVNQDDPNNLSFSDVRIMLDGLIKRDCEAPPPGYWKTPAGKKQIEEIEARKKRLAARETIMVNLNWTEPRPSSGDGDGGFSFGMKMSMREVTREELRELAADGWVFDDETMAWANGGLVSES